MSLKNAELFERLNETTSTIVETPNYYTLKTTKDPVISDDGTTYTAPAINNFGEEFIITWAVINPEITDESSICDWSNPVSVEFRN